MARATLSPNTDRHDQNSRRTPEVSSPSTALAPATPAHIPTARVRSAEGKVLVIVDRVAGMTRAAPRPITPRRRINSLAEPAVIATPEAAPKMASPISKVARRP